jgi:hypothetical protein
MSSRFETDFGNDGYDQPSRLKAFGGRYRFNGRTYSITVWAIDWKDAEDWGRRHGLQIDGQIIDQIEIL